LDSVMGKGFSNALSDNLIEHLTVEENVLLPMRLARKENEQRLRTLLDVLGLIHHRRAYPGQLSGGEAVRAGLAVALGVDPQILLADEPTGGVDATTEARGLDLLEEDCRDGGGGVGGTARCA